MHFRLVPPPPLLPCRIRNPKAAERKRVGVITKGENCAEVHVSVLIPFALAANVVVLAVVPSQRATVHPGVAPVSVLVSTIWICVTVAPFGIVPSGSTVVTKMLVVVLGTPPW